MTTSMSTTKFHLNTTVVAIFPNVCLWRRSLCSDLVLTLKTVSSHLHMPGRPMLLQYGPHFFSTLSYVFGQMVYRPPPWQKISRTPMLSPLLCPLHIALCCPHDLNAWNRLPCKLFFFNFVDHVLYFYAEKRVFIIHFE